MSSNYLAGIMKTLSPYLDELKRTKGISTDADLARLLKVSRAHVSQIRGGAHMGEGKCFELAIGLGREPLELLSLNRAIRSEDSKLRNYWLAIHDREGGSRRQE